VVGEFFKLVEALREFSRSFLHAKKFSVLLVRQISGKRHQCAWHDRAEVCPAIGRLSLVTTAIRRALQRWRRAESAPDPRQAIPGFAYSDAERISSGLRVTSAITAWFRLWNKAARVALGRYSLPVQRVRL
jgi:hypothetical protein